MKGIRPVKKTGGWWRLALVSPDGVVPSRTVCVSASVNLPLHHKSPEVLFCHWLTWVVPEKGSQNGCGVWCIVFYYVPICTCVCVSEHMLISLLILCAYPILSCKQLHPVSFLLNKYVMLWYLNEVLKYKIKADWLVRESPFMLYKVFHLYSWNSGTR